LAQNFTRKCNLKELVNQDNNFQQMPIHLHLPVKNGNEKYLKYLIEDLEADVDVNATDKDLRTPLLSIMLL